MISVSNLAMGFGGRTLFSGASFQLNPGERYGLVGANGSGKTTLLKILAGETSPSEGSVAIPGRLRVGTLKQDHFAFQDESVLDVALMGNRELWDALVEREQILARAEESFDADAYARVEEVVQLHDGYTAEARAATILEGLGIPTEVHRNPISTLSGGFKLRVLLAQVLAGNPDVLLLDEPTNHLDILSIRWLEEFLANTRGPLVVISHDHRFLDNVATHILDVDYETVLLYPGGYSDFVTAKTDERERREKELAGREKEIAHHRRFVDRFRAKASKARQAQSKLKLIEKRAGELEDLPETSRRYPTFRFDPQRPSGKDVLKVRGIRKSFDEREVLPGVDLDVARGDRLAILGPNGIGKSTLLKILMGELDPDGGEVEWGYETHPGYFSQNIRERFGEPNQTAEDWIWRHCPGKDRGFVRGHMALMLFSGDDALRKVGTLSGGEAARLVFSRLALERPNVLILDEPTNHLDMEAIEALVEGVDEFEGTLIFVSHDRWFVEQLASRILEITPDGIRDYRGSYEEYVERRGHDHLDAEKVVLKQKREEADRRRTSSNGNGTGSGKARRRGRDEAAHRSRLKDRSREVTRLVDEAEARLGEIDETFLDPEYFQTTPPEEVRALEAERERLVGKVDKLMQEWEQVERSLEEAR
ncbi:MAG: ATP-binding cassette domain-containing protein [Gemmatimonadales bacterium]|nr:MAG: ATP-binding cassette domain-containing protein [Gemmatimonadales bacterium]